VPVTAEDAAALHAARDESSDAAIPAAYLDSYREKDLDGLLQTMTRDDFNRVWPLLSKGLYANSARS
jgi:hypothetical protein